MLCAVYCSNKWMIWQPFAVSLNFSSLLKSYTCKIRRCHQTILLACVSRHFFKSVLLFVMCQFCQEVGIRGIRKPQNHLEKHKKPQYQNLPKYCNHSYKCTRCHHQYFRFTIALEIWPYLFCQCFLWFFCWNSSRC